MMAARTKSSSRTRKRTQKHTRNYVNLVIVRPFEGDPADDELASLSRYLEQLAAAPDFRRVEKRGWRKARE